jgi:hypothetical protein
MCADRRSASGYGQAIAMTASLQGLPSLHPAMLHLLRAGLGHWTKSLRDITHGAAVDRVRPIGLRLY